MKKYVIAVVLSACVFMSGICVAASSPDQLAPNEKKTIVDRNNDGKSDGVDIFNQDGRLARRGYDTDGDGYVDMWQATDENTGLPIVTQSDKAFELR